MLHYAETWGKARQQTARGFERPTCLKKALAQSNFLLDPEESGLD